MKNHISEMNWKYIEKEGTLPPPYPPTKGPSPHLPRDCESNFKGHSMFDISVHVRPFKPMPDQGYMIYPYFSS